MRGVEYARNEDAGVYSFPALLIIAADLLQIFETQLASAGQFCPILRYVAVDVVIQTGVKRAFCALVRTREFFRLKEPAASSTGRWGSRFVVRSISSHFLRQPGIIWRCPPPFTPPGPWELHGGYVYNSPWALRFIFTPGG